MLVDGDAEGSTGPKETEDDLERQGGSRIGEKMTAVKPVEVKKAAPFSSRHHSLNHAASTLFSYLFALGPQSVLYPPYV